MTKEGDKAGGVARSRLEQMRSSLPGMSSFPLDDSLVVMGQERLFVLNSTGRAMWEGLAAGSDLETVSLTLAEQYGVTLSVVRSDLETAIADWLSQLAETPGKVLSTSPSTQNPSAVPTPAPYCWRSYRLYETTFRIGFAAAEVEQAVHSLVAYLEVEPAEGGETLVVGRWGSAFGIWWRSGLVGVHHDLDDLAIGIIYQLFWLGWEGHDWLALLHAGGVTDGSSSILLPAPGGRGKSTLTAILIREGFGYLGDDVLPLDRASHCPIPLPLPMKVKEGSLEALMPLYPNLEEMSRYRRGDGVVIRFLPPPSLHEGPAPGRYPVKCIVTPAYRQGARTELRAISPAETLEQLMNAGTVLETPLREGDVAQLVAWVAQTPCYSLVHGDGREAAAVIRALFAG